MGTPAPPPEDTEEIDIEPDNPEPTDNVSSLGLLCADPLVQSALDLTNEERNSNGVVSEYVCDNVFAEAAGNHLEAVCQCALLTRSNSDFLRVALTGYVLRCWWFDLVLQR